MNLRARDLEVNNFDLIRLLVALQVILSHSARHLKVELAPWADALVGIFPGVPLFFFVSGFLISRSYEKNSRLREYARHRFLRIYPALITCTLVSLLAVSLTGYFSTVEVSFAQIAALVLGQITFLQFYNPDFMRGFGTGVLNGSLWTITVSLQFYVLTPVVYWIFGLKKKGKDGNRWLLALIVLFMAVNIVFNQVKANYVDTIPFKLWMVSFSPWFYMFLIGLFFQRNFDYFHRLLQNRFWLSLPAYVVSALAVYSMARHFGWNTEYGIKLLLHLMLGVMTFSLAYSNPSLSGRLLKRNDISYGIYIYHIPVINFFIYYGWVARVHFVAMAWGLTVAISVLSWVAVERPSLGLKNYPVKPSVRNAVPNQEPV
jgi:peptidoglycan/LPS O-acetylase OafA/YrhL